MKRKFCHYGWKERNCVLPTGDSEISVLKLLFTLDGQKSVYQSVC